MRLFNDMDNTSSTLLKDHGPPFSPPSRRLPTIDKSQTERTHNTVETDVRRGFDTSYMRSRPQKARKFASEPRPAPDRDLRHAPSKKRSLIPEVIDLCDERPRMKMPKSSPNIDRVVPDGPMHHSTDCSTPVAHHVGEQRDSDKKPPSTSEDKSIDSLNSQQPKYEESLFIATDPYTPKENSIALIENDDCVRQHATLRNFDYDSFPDEDGACDNLENAIQSRKYMSSDDKVQVADPQKTLEHTESREPRREIRPNTDGPSAAGSSSQRWDCQLKQFVDVCNDAASSNRPRVANKLKPQVSKSIKSLQKKAQDEAARLAIAKSALASAYTNHSANVNLCSNFALSVPDNQPEVNSRKVSSEVVMMSNTESLEAEIARRSTPAPTEDDLRRRNKPHRQTTILSYDSIHPDDKSLLNLFDQRNKGDTWKDINQRFTNASGRDETPTATRKRCSRLRETLNLPKEFLHNSVPLKKNFGDRSTIKQAESVPRNGTTSQSNVQHKDLLLDASLSHSRQALQGGGDQRKDSGPEVRKTNLRQDSDSPIVEKHKEDVQHINPSLLESSNNHSIPAQYEDDDVVFAQPSAGRNTIARPTTGGKTISPELWARLQEAAADPDSEEHSDSDPDEDEDEDEAATSASEQCTHPHIPLCPDSPLSKEDQHHWSYTVKRRVLRSADTTNNTDWITIGKTHSSLHAANAAAAQEFRMERGDIDVWPLRTWKWECRRDGMALYHGESYDGDATVDVVVDRFLHSPATAGRLPERKGDVLDKHIFDVFQRKTTVVTHILINDVEDGVPHPARHTVEDATDAQTSEPTNINTPFNDDIINAIPNTPNPTTSPKSNPPATSNHPTASTILHPSSTTSTTIETTILNPPSTSLAQANRLAHAHTLSLPDAGATERERRSIDFVLQKRALKDLLDGLLEAVEREGGGFDAEVEAEDVVVVEKVEGVAGVEGGAGRGESRRTTTAVGYRVWVVGRVLRAGRDI